MRSPALIALAALTLGTSAWPGAAARASYDQAKRQMIDDLSGVWRSRTDGSVWKFIGSTYVYIGGVAEQRAGQLGHSGAWSASGTAGYKRQVLRVAVRVRGKRIVRKAAAVSGFQVVFGPYESVAADNFSSSRRRKATIDGREFYYVRQVMAKQF